MLPSIVNNSHDKYTAVNKACRHGFYKFIP